ncbi:hypothetical protein [Gemella cuniculi]|uniref:hypothetical protein n=1 Tax=Gemella cuniculi TaxID=150240 RepID=UPI0004821544|nr:hypothetical protein [Gemella cuniculi]
MKLGILRIYRPLLLIAKRDEERKLEDLLIKLSPVLKFFLRGRYSPIEVTRLGRVIVKFAIINKSSGVTPIMILE